MGESAKKGRPPQIPKNGVGGWHTTGGGGNGYLRFPCLLRNSPIICFKKLARIPLHLQRIRKKRFLFFLFIETMGNPHPSYPAAFVCPPLKKGNGFSSPFLFFFFMSPAAPPDHNSTITAGSGGRLRLRLRLDLRGTSREEV